MREVKAKIKSILDKRDSRNSRTAELIEKIREKDTQLEENSDRHLQRKLSTEKKKLEVKLIKNKKIADKFHSQFIELTKEKQKLIGLKKKLSKKLNE